MLKGHLLMLLCILFSSTCKAQVAHEFKVNMLDFVYVQFTPMYEHIRSEKWAIEVGLPINIKTKETNPFVVGQSEFASLLIRPNISYKRYLLFNKEHGSHGLYIGPYLELGYSIFVEDGYVERLELIQGGEILEYQATPTGIKEIRTGLNVGFKFLIQEKYIIEPTILSTVGFDIGKGSAELGYVPDFRLIPTFRTGLRF